MNDAASVSYDGRPPGRVWLEDAWAEHPQRELLVERERERDASGERTWQLLTEDEPDDASWAQHTMRSFDAFDPRPSIRVCRWPKPPEIDAVLDQQASADEFE